MFYVILIVVGVIIGLPILKLLLKSGNKIFISAGILWGLLSLLPYFGAHGSSNIPFWLKIVTLPAWIVLSTLNYVTYNPDFFLHDFISSHPRLLRDVLVEILGPVLIFIGPPLFGGFIIWVILKLRLKRRG